MLPNSLFQAMSLLKSESKEVYLVGGYVRDSMLKKPSKDYDLVTDVPMDKIEEIFSANGWKVDATGANFLVMNVSKKVNVERERFIQDTPRRGSVVTEVVEETHIYEIANFRKDGVSTDGRRPDSVEIGTMLEDAQRRDFTINAMYFDPFTGITSTPIKESLRDIMSGTLRFIGNPKDRIEEDYLRVFRFYRFMNTKGLTADKKSLKACREMFNKAYELTTPERVRNEIERMV